MKSIHSQNLVFFGILCAVLLSGCGIPSVHPLYEKEDLILNEELTGQWTSKDNDRYYIFSTQDVKNNPSTIPTVLYAADEDSNTIHKGFKDLEKSTNELIEEGYENLYYIVKFTQGEIEELYYGGLIELDSQYYFDLYKFNFNENDAFSFPTHIFVKMDILDGKLELHEFRESYLKELIKNQQIRIKHEYANDNFLLTAPSKELQKFILKYGNETAAYDEKYIYTKISS